jgi:hypothetical protein
MPTDGAERLPRCRELEKLRKMVKNRNFIGITYFGGVLACPAPHITLPGLSVCPQTTPKGSRAVGNSKNYEKWSKNRNFIGITYFGGVMACPAPHITLPGLSVCPQTTPKGSRAVGNSKN